MSLSPQKMADLFHRTTIVKKPTYGIISGYHELPYVCLGEAIDNPSETMRVRGRIHVSPRFVIRPSHCEPSYEEIFGEENIDVELAGRVFGFLGFRGRPVECKSEHLEVEHLPFHLEKVLEEMMNTLERAEDITTGVFISPDTRYYPVSVERFVSSIVDAEFSV